MYRRVGGGGGYTTSGSSRETRETGKDSNSRNAIFAQMEKKGREKTQNQEKLISPPPWSHEPRLPIEVPFRSFHPPFSLPAEQILAQGLPRSLAFVEAPTGVFSSPSDKRGGLKETVQ